MNRTHIFTVDIPKSFFDRLEFPKWATDMLVHDVFKPVADNTSTQAEQFRRIKRAKVTVHESETLYIVRCSVRTELPFKAAENLVSRLVKNNVTIELSRYLDSDSKFNLNFLSEGEK